MSKKTLLIDFDATLASYTGWKGEAVLGDPLLKARHAMHILDREFRLVCFTTRAAKQEGKEAVEQWLRKYGFPEMQVTAVKLLCFLTVDDRAICFTGEWTDDLILRIRTFRPWWENADESVPSPSTPESVA